MEEGKGGGCGGGKNVPCALACIVKAAMSDTILVCFYLC